MIRSGAGIVVVLMLLLSADGKVGASAPRFSNLQILPEDATPAEVFQVMKLMTRALGTECRVCHRTGARDFAADAEPLKATTRGMMWLESTVRGGIDWRQPPADLCVDCHRGRLRPPPGGG